MEIGCYLVVYLIIFYIRVKVKCERVGNWYIILVRLYGEEVGFVLVSFVWVFIFFLFYVKYFKRDLKL